MECVLRSEKNDCSCGIAMNAPQKARKGAMIMFQATQDRDQLMA